MESCKELVSGIIRCLIEWRAVRSLLGDCKVSERVESYTEFVRRIVRSLTEWRAARSLLGEL